MKTGLLKYRVRPPNKVIIIPPINGTYGIFFHHVHNCYSYNCCDDYGGIAAVRLFPLL